MLIETLVKRALKVVSCCPTSTVVAFFTLTFYGIGFTLTSIGQK